MQQMNAYTIVLKKMDTMARMVRPHLFRKNIAIPC